MSTPKTPPAKIFPAPEWTGVSADIAASLAHEIRNPLLAIKGAAQLLAGVVSEDDKTLTQLIVAEANRIEQLVVTLDPLTPNPAVAKEPVNIHEVTEYVRLAAQVFAPEVQIITDYDPSIPPVMGARDALVQAVMNLVKNGCEAATPGSRLSPRKRQRGLASASELSRSGEGGAPLGSDSSCPHPKNAEGYFSTSPKGEVSPPAPLVTISTRYLLGERMQRVGGRKLPIQVKITDNGAGVAEELVARLFTPFTSTKTGGRGLGLAIVAKIAEEHEGLVAYEGQPGQGAVFSLYLPAA